MTASSFPKIILALFIILLVAACATQEEPTTTPVPPTILDVSGSGSVTALLEALRDDFEADTPGYSLRVLSGTGTGGGVEGVMNTSLDLAAMAREPKEDEPLEFYLLGQGANAVYTHPDVGVTTLTTEQVIDIFTGEITTWSEVGGPDLPIVLFVRDEADSSTTALRESVIGDAVFGQEAQVLTSQGDMQTAVEGTPGGVGIGTWPTAVAAGADVTPISIDGIAPTDPAYKMLSPLGIGYLAERQADVQPLLDWLSSDSGQTHLQELALIIGE